MFSCADKNVVENKTVLFYLVNSNNQTNIDTIPYKKNVPLDTADQFLAQDYFYINKTVHTIKAYTSDNHANPDGGQLYYTLDSIGVIYTRSTTWWSFVRLKSNNDSLNDLFNIALGHIIMQPKLSCYHCQYNTPVDQIKFVPPVVKK